MQKTTARLDRVYIFLHTTLNLCFSFTHKAIKKMRLQKDTCKMYTTTLSLICILKTLRKYMYIYNTVSNSL